MSDFYEYIFILLVVSALATVSEGLAPKKVRSAVGLALGIYLLYLILAPLPTFIPEVLDSLGSLGAADAPEGSEVYYDTALSAAEEGLAKAVSERFGIARENISVKIYDFDAASLVAGKIYIRLFGEGALADLRAISAYAEEIFGGSDGGAKCTVDIGTR